MDEEAAKKPARRKTRGQVHIKWEVCKGCGFCVEFCPKKVLKLSGKFNKKGYHPPEVANPDACLGCELCGLYCPDFAIFGEKVAIPSEDE